MGSTQECYSGQSFNDLAKCDLNKAARENKNLKMRKARYPMKVCIKYSTWNRKALPLITNTSPSRFCLSEIFLFLTSNIYKNIVLSTETSHIL